MQNKGLAFQSVHNFLNGFLADDIHAKRIYSLANAMLGVMSSASLAVNTIGQGLALARGGKTKHAIKQVDRLLSNQGVEVEELLALWVPYVIGSRPKIAVAMDWTDFDPDGQATLMLSLITNHGRATPRRGKRSVTTGISNPTRRSTELIRCSGKAACSTN